MLLAKPYFADAFGPNANVCRHVNLVCTRNCLNVMLRDKFPNKKSKRGSQVSLMIIALAICVRDNGFKSRVGSFNEMIESPL